MAPKAKPTKDSAKAMVRNGKKRMARPPEPTVAALSPPPLPPPSLPAADPPYPIVPPLVCAAGIWCTATTGDLAKSTHYCFDCRGRIHCALFCGEILEDYMNSDSCKFDVNKLSSEGRNTFNRTSPDVLYICQMCINRHEGHEGSTTNVDVPQDTSLDTSFDTSIDIGSSEPAEELYASLSAEHIFEEKNKSMKSLIVLCCGLKNSDGTNLIDINDDPWKSLPVATTKPNAADYKAEVTRRYHVLNLSGVGMKDPRPNQWRLDRLLEWLKLHPLRDASDVEFLQETVKNRKVVAERVVAQRANDKEVHDKAEKAWYGPLPILRLLCCLTDNDAIRRAYLTRNDISNDRIDLDNRNSDKRPKTVWELLSHKLNDHDFEAVTEPFPDLHNYYKDSIVIPHSKVSSLAAATPEKCKEKMSTMMVSLKRIVDKWERSGQGEGGIDVEIDGDETTGFEFGSLKNRSRGALESRSSFINDSPPYLLYLWEILDKYQLLTDSFSALSKKMSSKNGGKGVKSVFQRDDTNSTTNFGDDDSLISSASRATTNRDLVSSVSDLSAAIFNSFRMDTAQREKSELRGILVNLRAERRRLELMDMDIVEPSKKQKVNDQLTAIAEEISDLTEEMNIAQEAATPPRGGSKRS